QRLIAHLSEHREISTQQFKELVGGSRKFVIPLSEHFDREKVTLRVGDKRLLRGACRPPREVSGTSFSWVSRCQRPRSVLERRMLEFLVAASAEVTYQSVIMDPVQGAKRWERRKEARPGELVAAALQLFSNRGFAATRLEDVAAVAGVSKGT